MTDKIEVEFKVNKITEVETDKGTTTTYQLIPSNSNYKDILNLSVKIDDSKEATRSIGEKNLLKKFPTELEGDILIGI